ncbi:MAG: Fe-S cluster assembly protein HesB [Candidatus Marithrix sp.]
MLSITDKAAAQILQASKDGEMQGMALRLAPYTKENGSIEYNKMGFDAIKDDDIKIHCDGIDIVYEQNYQELLQDAVMDFVEIEADEFSFIFLNPNDPNYIPPK